MPAITDRHDEGRQTMRSQSIIRRRAMSIALVFVATLGVPTFASKWVVATVASTGALHPPDLSKLDLLGGVAHFKSTLATGTATIRYNLDLSGNWECGVGACTQSAETSPELEVRFQDNGTASQVIVDLKAYDLRTGATVHVMRFDSNRFASAAAFQTQRVVLTPIGSWYFDFENKIYFAEAMLIKTGSAGKPALGAIRFGFHY
jgi:hypothetical protein